MVHCTSWPKYRFSTIHCCFFGQRPWFHAPHAVLYISVHKKEWKVFHCTSRSTRMTTPGRRWAAPASTAATARSGFCDSVCVRESDDDSVILRRWRSSATRARSGSCETRSGAPPSGGWRPAASGDWTRCTTNLLKGDAQCIVKLHSCVTSSHLTQCCGIRRWDAADTFRWRGVTSRKNADFMPAQWVGHSPAFVACLTGFFTINYFLAF